MLSGILPTDDQDFLTLLLAKLTWLMNRVPVYAKLEQIMHVMSHHPAVMNV